MESGSSEGIKDGYKSRRARNERVCPREVGRANGKERVATKGRYNQLLATGNRAAAFFQKSLSGALPNVGIEIGNEDTRQDELERVEKQQRKEEKPDIKSGQVGALGKNGCGHGDASSEGFLGAAVKDGYSLSGREAEP